MKTIAVLLFSLTASGGAASASTATLLGNEIELVVPDGWLLSGDATQFPFQFLHDDPVGEILIFKSMLEGSDIINDASDLKLSVKKVVDSVILRLPQSQMLTNTGFYETKRTGFTLEFVSFDSTSGVMVRHRFTGMLYRISNDRQALFTVWAKTAMRSYESLAASMASIPESFRYTGKCEESVFPSSGTRAYWYLGLVVGLSAALLLYSRRRYTRTLEVQASVRREALRK